MNKSSCDNAAGCNWCVTTEECLSTSASCPDCDDYKTQAQCNAPGCSWCPSNETCNAKDAECPTCNSLTAQGKEQCTDASGCSWCSFTKQCVAKDVVCPEDSLSSLSEETITEVKQSGVRVVIELESGVKADEVDVDVIRAAVSSQSEMQGKQVVVELEVDEDGFVLRVIIYVQDDETGQSVVSIVQELKKGDTGISVFAQVKTVQLTLEQVSGAGHVHCIIATLISAVTFLVSMVLMF